MNVWVLVNPIGQVWSIYDDEWTAKQDKELLKLMYGPNDYEIERWHVHDAPAKIPGKKKKRRKIKWVTFN